jgi:SAM-dependent methyltransferase
MVTTADPKSAYDANRALYDEAGEHKYVDSAPHLKHRQIVDFQTSLIESIYSAATQNSETVRLLDLGTGEGSCAHPFLRLGARVTAVDISEHQLNHLQVQCKCFSHRLDLRHEDAWDALERYDRYDVVVANSFLHHVPDYLALIRRALTHIEAKGQYFSFQDPLRYDTSGGGGTFVIYRHKIRRFTTSIYSQRRCWREQRRTLPEKGYQFWERHFIHPSGAPKFYSDREYPVDIHCIAQAILTYLEYAAPDAGKKIERTLRWTRENMWAPDGYVYFQRHQFYTNRIPYTRWGQAWMFYALSSLRNALADRD